MPALRARSRAVASARSERTRPMSPPRSGASINACRLVPEPEARTAMLMRTSTRPVGRGGSVEVARRGPTSPESGLNLISMIENVPAQDWETWIDSTGGTVLDIREPFEWELGVLPDATLISMGEIPARIGELDNDQAFLVVCRSGGRSQQVAAYL